MIAEFGLAPGWLNHPSVLDHLWKIATLRWDVRAKERQRQEEQVQANQFARMHAQLRGH